MGLIWLYLTITNWLAVVTDFNSEEFFILTFHRFNVIAWSETIVVWVLESVAVWFFLHEFGFPRSVSFFVSNLLSSSLSLIYSVNSFRVIIWNTKHLCSTGYWEILLRNKADQLITLLIWDLVVLTYHRVFNFGRSVIGSICSW